MQGGETARTPETPGSESGGMEDAPAYAPKQDPAPPIPGVSGVLAVPLLARVPRGARERFGPRSARGGGRSASGGRERAHSRPANALGGPERAHSRRTNALAGPEDAHSRPKDAHSRRLHGLLRPEDALLGQLCASAGRLCRF